MKRLITLVLAGSLFMGMVAPVPAGAINVFDECANDDTSEVCKASKTDTSATESVKNIINLLLFGLGVIAVIMIIWGGFKYVTSRGDAAKVKEAKDTVSYTIVGVIVALLAYAVVTFVISRF